MALEPLDHSPSPFRALYAQRYVLAALAAILLILVLSRSLSLLAAMLSAVAIIAAVGISLVVEARQQWVRGGQKTEAADPSAIDDSIHALIEATPIATLMIDREGYVTAFNRQAAEFAPTLRRAEHVMFALRMPAILDAIRRAAASGEPQQTEISERVPIDRWFEVQVNPTSLMSAGGRALTLITLQDLTPLRRVEEMRADFVANASHELRTPLAALSGFIDTLQGPARNDALARDRFLGIMRAQADRMARVIQDLLSLSRIELDAHIRPADAIDLTGVVGQVVDGLQMLARERGVDISVSGPETLPTVGDRDELLRVFENLIENALKYGGSGKRVEVTLTAPASEGGDAKVAIRDFGPGIAPEHLPRLTERFYRVDVSHSRAEGGTGLGLSLVKHILNRHRGRLAIDSIVGTGSNFTVYLPVPIGAVGTVPNPSIKPAA